MVPSARIDSLPVDAVRDLLGIARALYAERRAAGAGERALAEIACAGKDLKMAIGMARRGEPGSVGHRRAWELAESAYERLLEQLSVTSALLPVVEAAFARVRARPTVPTDRDERMQARRTRG